MDTAKKQHERFLLDRFLEIQGISPTTVQAIEPPDFLIELEGLKVGIEVTELYVRRGESTAHPRPEEPPLPQAMETITDQIVSKARKIYFEAGNPLLMSTIWFSEGVELDKKKGDLGTKKRGQIAELIAHQIRSMSLQDSEVAAWRSSEAGGEERSLSEWVDMIHTQRVPEYRDAQWRDRFAWWKVARPGLASILSPELFREVVDEAIKDKAQRISVYKKCAGTKEIWLLIFANRTLPSQRFFVAPGFSEGWMSSPFAKTFYCDFVHREVIEFPRGEDR